MGTLHLAVNVLDLMIKDATLQDALTFLFRNTSGHTSGEIFFKFYLEPLTSFWQAQDGATRRIQGARGLAVGDRPPIPSWVYMGRTTGGSPARKIKLYIARLQAVLDIVIVPNRILYL